jgi:hypothetical protein
MVKTNGGLNKKKIKNNQIPQLITVNPNLIKTKIIWLKIKKQEHNQKIWI